MATTILTASVSSREYLAKEPMTEAARIMIDFLDAARVNQWRGIHDVVMGGVSSGQVQATGDGAQFAGEVSLEQGGGFASFRLLHKWPDLRSFEGLRLRVEGDGKVYKLSLRCDGAWDGVSWQARFRTKAEGWQDVFLPFAEFEPTIRGRVLDESYVLNLAKIEQFGLLIADRQAGAYRLTIEVIEAYKAK